MTARRCKVCVHPALEAIDDDLADGEPIPDLAELHGLAKNALRVHRREHLSTEHAERFRLYKDSRNWTMRDQQNLETTMRKVDAMLGLRSNTTAAQTQMLARMREAAEMNEARRRARPRTCTTGVTPASPKDNSAGQPPD